MIARYPHIVQVRMVHLRDVETVADLLPKKWEPLNIIKTVKRFLWWKKVDYVVLFGQPRRSPRSTLG